MLSVIECLDRASEMERRSTTSPTLALLAECLDAAIRWRDLARRALIHGEIAIIARASPADSE